MAALVGPSECACCNNPCEGLFCRLCEVHVLPGDGELRFWQRTYQFRYKQPCPYRHARPW